MFTGKAKSILGLDIGSHSIKAVVLDKTRSGLVLKNLGLTQLPPESVIEGNIEEKEVVAGAIKNLIKSLKIDAKNVCTSISGYSVIIKKINLPTQTYEELLPSIEVEAEQYIPFDISEVNIDFQIMGGEVGKEGEEGEEGEEREQMEVILVAAKKELVESYIDVLAEARLIPTIIDVDAFAMENAFIQTHPDKLGTIALVDIGASKMNINILKGGMSFYTKDAPMGGARITQGIQDSFEGMDYEMAEGVKAGGLDAPDTTVTEKIVTQAVESWVAESKRAVDFMEASFPGEKLDEIYLSGGSSRIHGLADYFQNEMGAPVHILNPFQTIGFNKKKFDPAYIEYIAPQVAICLGLALRRGEEI